MDHRPPDEELAEDRRIALLHAPAAARPALTALLALDRALARVLRTTREPMIGQMRLAWWRDALARLDAAPPPAEPALRAVAAELVTRGVGGATLSTMVDGWEALIAEPPDIARFAADRGGGLFAAAAAVLGADGAMIAAAGEGWALADLATHVTDGSVARAAADLARERLTVAFARPWPRRARPLGMLALLARADLDGVPAGSPGRAARMLAHRLTGR